MANPSKKIRINSLSAFFEFVIIKKIKKKKLVKLKKKLIISLPPNEFPLWLYFWKNYVMNNWLCWIPQHNMMSEFEIHAEELNQTKYEFVKLFFDSETVFKRSMVIKIKDSVIHLVWLHIWCWATIMCCATKRVMPSTRYKILGFLLDQKL